MHKRGGTKTILFFEVQNSHTTNGYIAIQLKGHRTKRI